jgi:Ca2+-binding EF-hand superfamily protein
LAKHNSYIQKIGVNKMSSALEEKYDGSPKDSLVASFKSLDVNNDGLLQRDDLVEVLEQVHFGCARTTNVAGAAIRDRMLAEVAANDEGLMSIADFSQFIMRQ